MDTLITAPSMPQPVLDGSGLTVGIVVARYNWEITGSLLLQARNELHKLHVAPENTHVVYVPGAYELATAAQAMLRGGSYDVLICFGCVMQGETRHDVVVGDAAAQGIQRVALDAHIPVIFGVICARTHQQAIERIPRGRECAQAAVEMAQILRDLVQKEKTAEREKEQHVYRHH